VTNFHQERAKMNVLRLQCLHKTSLESFVGQTMRQARISPYQVISSFSTNSRRTAGSVTNTNAKNDNTDWTTTPVGGFLKQTWEKYSVQGQQRRNEAGERLFRAAQWRAMDPAWYGKHKVPISFRPQHALLSMHVWFLHKRLIVNSEINKTVSNATKGANTPANNLLIDEELFDIFWNDTRSRIRAVEGIHELTLNKHLKDAQQATFLQCTQYDHAFLDFGDDDPNGRFQVICDAVWKHVLGGEDDADDELIRRLGAYVMYQAENVISSLPEEYFVEGRVNWGSMPDLDSDRLVADTGSNEDGIGSSHGILDARGRGLERLDEKGIWMKVLTDAGHPYFWNTDTNVTCWEQPNM